MRPSKFCYLHLLVVAAAMLLAAVPPSVAQQPENTAETLRWTARQPRPRSPLTPLSCHPAWARYSCRR